MGPETGYASIVHITIYLRVNGPPFFHHMSAYNNVRPIFRRYYGTIVPSLLSIIHGFCFCIMNSILGGQALGSLAPIGERCVTVFSILHFNPSHGVITSIGITLIAAISLFVSECSFFLCPHVSIIAFWTDIILRSQDCESVRTVTHQAKQQSEPFSNL